MSCLFAQKKKSECNRKKKEIYRGALLFIHREKKYHTESLSYPSRCYKVPGKSP